MKTNVKTKLLLSWTQNFELDVYIDASDNLQQLYDYIDYIFQDKKIYILNDIIEEKNCTKVGKNINLVNLEKDKSLKILNEGEIYNLISELEDSQGDDEYQYYE